MQNKSYLILALLSCFVTAIFGQNLLEVSGNGIFTSPSSTNVDILNINNNTNTQIRFGDNNTIKSSAGFHGTNDVFKISMDNILDRNDVTISQSGNLGINTLPSNHKFLILHNSTSGTNGSAHLTLRENGDTDFARLRFENTGDDGLWTIAGRATGGNANLNFFHHDGTNFANILSIDGDNSYVGILTTDPEGYLHIRQETAGVHALLLENDAGSGGEKWAFQVGTDDLEVYLNDFHIGSFNATTGAYSFFGPPPSAQFSQPAPSGILEKIAKLQPKSYARSTNQPARLWIDPHEVEKIDPQWVVRSEDGMQVGFNQQTLTVVSIQSIQEQQVIIQRQQEEISRMEKEGLELKEMLEELEIKLKTATIKKED